MIKFIDDDDTESERTGTEIPGPIKMDMWVKSPLSFVLYHIQGLVKQNQKQS